MSTESINTTESTTTNEAPVSTTDEAPVSTTNEDHVSTTDAAPVDTAQVSTEIKQLTEDEIRTKTIDALKNAINNNEKLVENDVDLKNFLSIIRNQDLRKSEPRIITEDVLDKVITGYKYNLRQGSKYVFVTQPEYSYIKPYIFSFIAGANNIYDEKLLNSKNPDAGKIGYIKNKHGETFYITDLEIGSSPIDITLFYIPTPDFNKVQASDSKSNSNSTGNWWDRFTKKNGGKKTKSQRKSNKKRKQQKSKKQRKSRK